MSRSRYHSLVTYANDRQLKKVLAKHINSIRSFGYILHDQDEAAPHYHVIMRLHDAWTPTQIKRWFNNLFDDEHKPINTFDEVANDMEAMEEYILHEDQKSIEEGKHRYSPDGVFWMNKEQMTDKRESKDDTYEILLKLMQGCSYLELVKFYGRDFLYHYNQYEEVAMRCGQQLNFTRFPPRLEAEALKFSMDVNGKELGYNEDLEDIWNEN